VRESWNPHVHFEAFNVFNISNYDVPSALAVNSNVTRIVAKLGRAITLPPWGMPKQLQFELRFVL
jgi:hypothetical protein